MRVSVLLVLLPLGAAAADAPSAMSMTAATKCGDIKSMYKSEQCCGNPDKISGFQMVPMPGSFVNGRANPCQGAKPTHVSAFDNAPCFTDSVVAALEQSGTNVTAGYQGAMDVGDRVPITTSYMEAGLCPVNVHWHLGAEHMSVGQYDANPSQQTLAGGSDAGCTDADSGAGRRLAGGKPHCSYRRGFRCNHYNARDSRFLNEYNWQHCVDMHVGETYEIHWPHSAGGMCGTPNQYQSPFYDGVFCSPGDGFAKVLPTQEKIGVQGQVFTIINDENYYYPDLIRGAIIDGDMWADVAKYTGSTTGTSRNNTVCSYYTPITWQVDRKCHLISASSFDKMCADMKSQRADMSTDLHAHGARELVDSALAANNHHRRI